jgi:hypothetical protein
VVTERPLHSLPTKLRQASNNHPVLMWVCKVEIRWLNDSEITAGWMPKLCGSQILSFKVIVSTLWLFNIAMENDPFSSMIYLLKVMIFHGYVE